MVQDYNGEDIDNRFIKVVSDDGILYNQTGGLKILGTFDEGLRFRGEIIFKDNKVGRDFVLNMYYSLVDCYSSMIANYTDTIQSA